MARPTVQPTGKESPYDEEELIVSKTDLKGRITYANDVFLRMTGYSRDELNARELTWRRMTPPEWVEVSETQMQKLAETGRIGPYEKEYILKDGSRSWMMFAGRQLDASTVVEYCIDISDRKHVEMERELLIHELSHRVKNVFAVIQSMAAQTRARAVETLLTPPR